MAEPPRKRISMAVDPAAPLRDWLGVELDDMLAVATEVLRQAGDNVVTEAQLHKLLFFATGIALALTGGPLFADEFKAYECGTVLPRLHQVLKRSGHNGRRPVRADEMGPFLTCGERSKVAVRMAVILYGRMSGTEMSRITHEPGSPWCKHCKHGPAPPSFIPNDDIRAYFSTDEEMIKLLRPLSILTADDCSSDTIGAFVMQVLFFFHIY